MKHKKKNGDIITRDQMTVVLERIDDKLDVLKEGQDVIVSIANRRYEEAQGQFDILKTELALIRHRLVNPEEVRMLELRVSALEKKVR